MGDQLGMNESRNAVNTYLRAHPGLTKAGLASALLGPIAAGAAGAGAAAAVVTKQLGNGSTIYTFSNKAVKAAKASLAAKGVL